MRMKIPLINIRNKIEAEAAGKFVKADIDVSIISDSYKII